MKRKHFICMILLIASTILAANIIFTKVSASPTLSVSPATTIVLLGEEFTVDVNLDYAANLYGFEIWLSFDNTVLNATAINYNSYLYEPTMIWYQVVHNPGGWASLSVSSQFPASGKTGGSPPALATVHFKGIANGTSTLHLYNTHLVDDSAMEIAHSTSDGQVFVNTPPVASNLAITPSTPFTTDNLVGSYDYYDAEGDPESGSEIRWYKDTVLQPGLNDMKIVSYSLTSKGETWYFTVKPKDGKHFGTLKTSPSVTVLNSAPTAPVVDVTPDSPVTTDNLVCTVTTASSDADLDTITYTYKWYKDGVLNQTTSGTTSLTDTIPSTLTADGETWKCVVTPNDGTVDGPSDDDQAAIGTPNLVVDSVVVMEQGCTVYANDTYVNGTAYYVPVEVAVENVGIAASGSFNVSLTVYWINGSLQEDYVEWRVSGLSAGDNITLTYSWRPTHTGYYNLTAVVDCDSEVAESDEGDNTLVLSDFPVALMGDVSGDGTVGIVDAVIVSLAWASRPGDLNWNVCADLNHDGVINISDGVRIMLHWNQTW